MDNNGTPQWQQDIIKKSSVPLPGGGDTHFHPFGPGENDYTVTTRLPNGIVIHDKP